jgi:5-methylcytosine-specific restriction endonuclease McrA
MGKNLTKIKPIGMTTKIFLAKQGATMEALIIFIFLVVIYITAMSGTTTARPTYKRPRHKEYKEPEIDHSKYPEAIKQHVMEYRADKKKYLQSMQWRKVSQTCKALANYKCQHCGSTSDLNAHHTNYKCLTNENPALDLVCLCQQCHTELHDRVGYPQTVDEYLSFQGPISVLKD